ncbi:MAG: SDR family oxidoreductase [Polyangiaceae bacterium]
MSDLVLITGTSSGIGLATAVECAAAGMRVVATLRNLDKRGALEKAAKERGVKLDVEQLDVTSKTAAAKVREIVLKYGPVYALVNNAGVAVGGAFEEQSEDDVRDQFETNVFGLMAMTRAALPFMRAAGRGRIINVSSISGRLSFPLLSVYGATKHAVEGFSEGLRWEVEPFGIQVVSVEPGTVKTPIFADNQRRGALISPDSVYAEISRRVEQLIMDGVDKGIEAADVGAAIARLVSDPSPPFRVMLGNDARGLVALRRLLPDRLFSLGMRRVLRKKNG